MARLDRGGKEKQVGNKRSTRYSVRNGDVAIAKGELVEVVPLVVFNKTTTRHVRLNTKATRSSP